MFFVRKENIATVLGTQKEHQAAQRRGIEFFAERSAVPGHSVWHYLWPAEKVEPGIRASVNLPARAAADTPDPVVGEEAAHPDQEHEPQFYIWSQEVAPGMTVGDPLITAYNGDGYGGGPAWSELARTRWNEAQSRAAAAPVTTGQ